MPIESDTERAVFLETDEFGASVTYTPSGGSPTAIEGIFDAAYVGVDVIGGGAPIESVGPAVTVRTSDVPAVAHDDAVTVGGNAYAVRGIENDGTGLTVLRLRKTT